MQRAAGAMLDSLDAIGAARDSGASGERLAEALALQRRAQWRLDFVNAENSMGFHADQESARVLAEAIDFARRAQIATLER
jgi:nitrite reductase (cytochrome c-552)